MAIAKWIGGAIGWISGGVLGGILGFCIGTLIDEAAKGSSNSSRASNFYDNGGGAYGSQNGYGQSGYGSRVNQGDRNSFLFSMLVLSSYIIRADGRVMHSEMEMMRQFLRRNFGEVSVAQGEQILLRLFDLQKERGMTAFRGYIQQSCMQINQHMDYSQRLQLMAFLVAVARVDGTVADAEMNALVEIAQYLSISQQDFESIFYMGSGSGSGSSSGNGTTYNNVDELEKAYKVLGVSRDATDAEVKAAYRKMALKHHPDRVATLGEDIRKAAEEKFQEINSAKEKIWKARGI